MILRFDTGSSNESALQIAQMPEQAESHPSTSADFADLLPDSFYVVLDTRRAAEFGQVKAWAKSAARESKNFFTVGQSVRISSCGSGSDSASLNQVRLLAACW